MTITNAISLNLPDAGNATHDVQAQLLLVSPVDARQWVDQWRYPRQRTFYPRLAGYYASIMERGEWAVSTLIVAEYTGPDTTVVKHGQRWLINGYHRLEGLIMADLTLAFVIEIHQIADESDIHALYAVQDRGRSRSINDVFRSLGLSDELGWKESELRLVGEGQPLITHDFGTYAKVLLVDPYERADFIREWRAEGRDWLDCIKLARLRRYAAYLGASPVTAVALVTLRYQREKALTMWMDVARNDGLRAGTPEHTLATFLLSTRVREMAVREYARYVAQAWNSYYRDKGLTKMMGRGGDAPIKILGTPYGGPATTGKENDTQREESPDGLDEGVPAAGL